MPCHAPSTGEQAEGDVVFWPENSCHLTQLLDSYWILWDELNARNCVYRVPVYVQDEPSTVRWEHSISTLQHRRGEGMKRGYLLAFSRWKGKRWKAEQPRVLTELGARKTSKNEWLCRNVCQQLTVDLHMKPETFLGPERFRTYFIQLSGKQLLWKNPKNYVQNTNHREQIILATSCCTKKRLGPRPSFANCLN